MVDSIRCRCASQRTVAWKYVMTNIEYAPCLHISQHLFPLAGVSANCYEEPQPMLHLRSTAQSCRPRGHKGGFERSPLALVHSGLARSSESHINEALRMLWLLAPCHCSADVPHPHRPPHPPQLHARGRQAKCCWGQLSP